MPRSPLESMLAAAAELEQLGHQRLRWARNGDWEALLQSEDRRGELARKIDARQVPPDSADANSLARRLERIRELDRELEPLWAKRQEQLGQDLQQIRRGTSGTRAYQQVDRGRG